MAKRLRKYHITRWWNKVFTQRKYKDKLFCKVFQNKKDLLALYNAISRTDYKDPAALEITTIDNEIELKLSDAFVPPLKDGETPVLECRVRMLNINMGHNWELMQGCRRLWEYAAFVETVNTNLSKGYPLDRAVNAAIDACIQQDILKDILIQSRSEVLLMFLTEYDEKLHMENTFEEGREAGLEQGLKQGQKMGLEQGQEQILILSQRLLSDNRLEDLKKASFDKQFLEKLLEEYHLRQQEKQ